MIKKTITKFFKELYELNTISPGNAHPYVVAVDSY